MLIYSFHQDRLVLIGDAAHPMLPSFAQGAVQAFEDSYILASCLKYGTLNDFDKLRKSRIEKVQTQSRENMELYHSHALKRTILFNGAKWMDRFHQETLIKRLDWLYSYDVKSAVQS